MFRINQPKTGILQFIIYRDRNQYERRLSELNCIVTNEACAQPRVGNNGSTKGVYLYVCVDASREGRKTYSIPFDLGTQGQPRKSSGSKVVSEHHGNR